MKPDFFWANPEVAHESSIRYQAGGFDVINRAVMWYPLDAAVVEPGVRALQEMCDLGPLVRPIALKADPHQKNG